MWSCPNPYILKIILTSSRCWTICSTQIPTCFLELQLTFLICCCDLFLFMLLSWYAVVTLFSLHIAMLFLTWCSLFGIWTGHELLNLNLLAIELRQRIEIVEELWSDLLALQNRWYVVTIKTITGNLSPENSTFLLFRNLSSWSKKNLHTYIDREIDLDSLRIWEWIIFTQIQCYCI